MKLECLIKLEVDSSLLEAIFKALYPETTRSISSRISVVVEKYENSIVLKFNAKDPTALRAALNSYLRWFSAVKKSLEIVRISL